MVRQPTNPNRSPMGEPFGPMVGHDSYGRVDTVETPTPYAWLNSLQKCP